MKLFTLERFINYTLAACYGLILRDIGVTHASQFIVYFTPLMAITMCITHIAFRSKA